MGNNLVKKENEMQSALLRIVQEKDIDPERLEKFLDLQIRMEEKQARVSFNEALSGFQSDCPIITKNKKTEFQSSSGKTTKYDYAPLDEIVYVIKPHLKTWGLSYSFNIKATGDKTSQELVTRIRHEHGHFEDFSYFFNPLHDDKRMNQSQRAKSASTYAKRVGIENALGLVTAGEDDDAKRASDTPMSTKQRVEINILIEETKTDKEKLMEFLSIEDFDSMSGYQAKKAIHALNQKRSQNV